MDRMTTGIDLVRLVRRVVIDLAEGESVEVSPNVSISRLTDEDEDKAMELVYCLSDAIEKAFNVKCPSDFKLVKRTRSMSLRELTDELARRAGLPTSEPDDWQITAVSDQTAQPAYIDRRSGVLLNASMERVLSLVECPAFWVLSLDSGSTFFLDHLIVNDDPRSWNIYGGADFVDRKPNRIWVGSTDGGRRVSEFTLSSSSNIALSFSRRLLTQISYNDWGFIARSQKNALIQVETSISGSSFSIEGVQVRSNLPFGRDLSFGIRAQQESEGVRMQVSGGTPDMALFQRLLKLCQGSHESEAFFSRVLGPR